MSVFKKKYNTLPSDFEMVDDDAPMENKIEVSLNFSRPRPVRYTIDQAAKLVHSLKDHNVSARVIAGIMKKTLESVDINIVDIIDDARLKEAAINTETARQDEMIESLIKKVDALQHEKLRFQKELEKTVYVREFLQQALDTSDTATSAASQKDFPRLSPEKVAKTMSPAANPAV